MTRCGRDSLHEAMTKSDNSAGAEPRSRRWTFTRKSQNEASWWSIHTADLPGELGPAHNASCAGFQPGRAANPSGVFLSLQQLETVRFRPSGSVALRLCFHI